MHRLRCGDGGIGVAHQRHRNRTALQHHIGLHAKEGRRPHHQIGDLAHFDAADMIGHALRNRRIDGIFGDIALGARIIIVSLFFRQAPALHLHLMRGLPGADDHLPHAAHRLTIGRHHADGADIMQDVFRRDSFLADAAFGKGNIFRNARIKMMADHEHIQMLIHRVHRIGHGGVGGRRQHARFTDQAQNIRRMAATRTFGMEGLNGAAANGLDGFLNKTAFIQRVGMDGDLNIHLIRDRKAGINRLRCGAPILMQFQAAGACPDLFFQTRRQRSIPLAEEAKIHRKTLGGLQHALHMPRPGRTGGGECAMRRSGAAAEHGGNAGRQRFFNLLRANEMDMHINSARGQDTSFAGDDLRPRPDDDVHIGLRVGIARLADGGNAPAAQADIRLHHAPMIQDQRIGDHGIHRAIGACHLRLAHAIADHLAAAEFHFLTIGGQVALNLDEDFRIGQAHTVAHCWAIHAGIGGARDFRCHGSDRPFRFAAKAMDDARA